MRTQRSRGTWLGAALAGAALLATTPLAALAQDDIDTFTYAPNNPVVTDLDPATSYSNEVTAMHNIYESLTHYDSATGEVLPSLATEWSASDDALTWTFTLRDDVTFHSGEPMDAEAAKAAFERTRDLGLGAGYIWSGVESFEASDATTLVMNLSWPAPMDLIAAANYAAYVYDVNAAGEGASEEELVAFFGEGNDAGTGPYALSSWEPGAEFEVTLDAYPEYWGGWDGDHYEEVVFRVVPEETTALQLVKAGEVSAVERLTPQLIDSLRSDENVQIIETPSLQNLMVLLNTASGPLADPAVRAAVAKAVDAEGIGVALAGAVEPSKGVIPPGLIGYSDELTGTGLDLAGAAELLAGTGYGPDGEPLQLTMTYAAGDTDEMLVGASLKSNLAELGLDLDVQALEWQAQWDRAISDNLEERQDIFVMYWWPDYPDPFSWFISMFRSEDEPTFNLSYYSDADMDAAIDGIQSLTVTDRAAAEQQYIELQQKLIDEAAVVVPYVQSYQRALDASVGGYVDDPAYAQVPFVYDMYPLGD
jgi:peptide/nickel transport system substrate-binding protein